MNELQKLTVTRKRGNEPFHMNGTRLEFDVESFWQWSASDLVSNATRGVVAEYIVARALGLAQKDVRDEWAPYDLQTPSGVKVEVKSAAYIQSWHQDRLSAITFKTPKTRAWDANTNTQAREAKRQADVYVFALLNHKDKGAIDPLNLDQWCFYVVSTASLDGRTRSQHSITLKSLEKLCPDAVSYAELRKAVEECVGRTFGNR
jgi:hypothetical protein